MTKEELINKVKQTLTENPDKCITPAELEEALIEMINAEQSDAIILDLSAYVADLAKIVYNEGNNSYEGLHISESLVSLTTEEFTQLTKKAAIVLVDGAGRHVTLCSKDSTDTEVQYTGTVYYKNKIRKIGITFTVNNTGIWTLRTNPIRDISVEFLDNILFSDFSELFTETFYNNIEDDGGVVSLEFSTENFSKIIQAGIFGEEFKQFTPEELIEVLTIFAASFGNMGHTANGCMFEYANFFYSGYDSHDGVTGLESGNIAVYPFEGYYHIDLGVKGYPLEKEEVDAPLVLDIGRITSDTAYGNTLRTLTADDPMPTKINVIGTYTGTSTVNISTTPIMFFDESETSKWYRAAGKAEDAYFEIYVNTKVYSSAKQVTVYYQFCPFPLNDPTTLVIFIKGQFTTDYKYEFSSPRGSDNLIVFRQNIFIYNPIFYQRVVIYGSRIDNWYQRVELSNISYKKDNAGYGLVGSTIYDGRKFSLDMRYNQKFLNIETAE